MRGTCAGPAGRALLVYAVAVGVMLQSIGGAFVSWDDGFYLLDNARMTQPGWAPLWDLWSPRTAYAGGFVEYFPLRDSVYFLLARLFGFNPVPFHICSVLLHGGVCVVLLRMLERLGAAPRAALLATLLFAVHPVHVESVAWVSALKDPLFALFLLMALDRYWHAAGPQGLWRAAVLLVLSLLCKSLGVVFPALALLVEVLHLGRPLRQAVRKVLPFAVLCAVALVHMVVVGRANDVIRSWPGGSAASGAMTALWVLLEYAANLVAPVDLNARYIMAPVTTPADVRFAAAVAFALLVTVACRLLWRRSHLPSVVALWLVVALLPVLNLVPIPIEMADRYLYLPSVAYCWGAGVAVHRLLHRRAAPWLTVGVLSLLGWLTTQRVTVWQDSVHLWSDAADQPDADLWPPVFINLGNAHLERGNVAAAVQSWQRAEDATLAHPHYPKPATPAVLLANVFLAAGDAKVALAHVDTALQVEPLSADVWRMMARVQTALGDPQKARLAQTRAAQLSPAPQ